MKIFRTNDSLRLSMLILVLQDLKVRRDVDLHKFARDCSLFIPTNENNGFCVCLHYNKATLKLTWRPKSILENNFSSSI